MNDMDYINKQREVRKIKDRIDAMDSIPEIADVAFSPSPYTKALYAFSTLSHLLSLSIL